MLLIYADYADVITLAITMPLLLPHYDTWLHYFAIRRHAAFAIDVIDIFMMLLMSAAAFAMMIRRYFADAATL